MTQRRKPLVSGDVFRMLDGRGTTWLCEQLKQEFDINIQVSRMSNYKHALRTPKPELLEAIKTILSPAAAAKRMQRSRTQKKVIDDEKGRDTHSTLTGRGVPQDDVEAARWYRRAAEQGHAGAQYNLGVMYYNGERVPQEDVEAYLWTNLAATYADASDRDRYAEFRDDAAERLTPEQRADAQRRAREFFEAHPPE